MPITEYQRKQNRRRYEEAKIAYAAFIPYYPLSLDDLPGEEWKPIKGFDDYAVSTFGRVKSFKRKNPIIRKPVLRGVYLFVGLGTGGEKKKGRSIHLLVAQAFIPNPENKPEVNHDDGNKFNCHVSNLYWSTSAENQQHAVKAGLQKVGVDNGRAKIKDEADIVYIRENPDNLTLEQLAEKFGMAATQISLIQRGKTYKEVGGTIRESKIKRVSDETKQKIRADWATGLYTQRELAEKYGVSQPTISCIVKN